MHKKAFEDSKNYLTKQQMCCNIIIQTYNKKVVNGRKNKEEKRHEKKKESNKDKIKIGGDVGYANKKTKD